ncbi:hypothetical protein L3Y34_010362 [Caenorhabditis briggsae]|uniref:Uncharacterized protein n=1 Tax=Caenorhabditis briggsae TaxID=6238 RepID=A0AAE8ZLF4_CAEBR|nr:hypothetical protein L3Y34_010362 [Caenorhabditis briggsae]
MQITLQSSKCLTTETEATPHTENPVSLHRQCTELLDLHLHQCAEPPVLLRLRSMSITTVDIIITTIMDFSMESDTLSEATIMATISDIITTTMDIIKLINKNSNTLAGTNNEALEKWKLRLLNAISITIDEQPPKSADTSTNSSDEVIAKSAESSTNSSNEPGKQVQQADSSSRAWCVCMPEDESERKIVIGFFIASIVILLFVILLACVTE